MSLIVQVNNNGVTSNSSASSSSTSLNVSTASKYIGDSSRSLIGLRMPTSPGRSFSQMSPPIVNISQNIGNGSLLGQISGSSSFMSRSSSHFLPSLIPSAGPSSFFPLGSTSKFTSSIISSPIASVPLLVSSTILPPNTTHHQLFYETSSDSAEELDVMDTSEPFSKYHYSLQSYLVDHNYSLRPQSICGEDKHFLLTPAPPSLLQANLNSIQEAGVGPMAPLLENTTTTHNNNNNEENETIQNNYRHHTNTNTDYSEDREGEAEEETIDDEDEDDDKLSVSSNEDKGGEETETAPEAEAEDDSITRCICDFLHDDGYMICCDKCSVWQHVVCMGLDKNNIPDEYLCEICKPRTIDRKKAKGLQARRRTELLYNSSNSSFEDNDNDNEQESFLRRSKKLLERNKSLRPFSGNHRAFSLSRLSRGKRGGGGGGGEIKKKSFRKRKAQGQLDKNEGGTSRKHGRSKYTEEPEVQEGEETEGDKSEVESASMSLRSWIDQYEEAVTNHYSPELRARLASLKVSQGELKASVIGGPTRCSVSLRGNGVKILTANTALTPNTPIIECKGKLMSASQFRLYNNNNNKGGGGGSSLSTNDSPSLSSLSPHFMKSNSTPSPPPYVLFYSINESLEICVDGSTYGNESRFCRRSSQYNARLSHVLDKGSLHIFIVTHRAIDKYQEILLPLISTESHFNGSLSIEEEEEKNSIRNIRLLGSSTSLSSPSSPEDSISLPLKVRRKRGAVKDKRLFIKSRRAAVTQKDVQGKYENEDDRSVGEEEKTNNNGLQSGDKVFRGSQNTVPTITPTKVNSSKVSPTKLGLPDSSGLIVGVNTINYDASLRNKLKSREERKMEMIMKAIEAMEKAEQRKKETSTTASLSLSESNKTLSLTPHSSSILSSGDNSIIPSGTSENLDKKLRRRTRRQSHSSLKHYLNVEPVSSGDEGAGSETVKAESRKVKKGRKTSVQMSSSSSPPNRSESRVLSPESISPEDVSSSLTIGSSERVQKDKSSSSSSLSTHQPFRFPKTKKRIVSDWLQQEEEEEEDVSCNYLRGSRSPPGIANHLLRTSTSSTPSNLPSLLTISNNSSSSLKSVCSAKKRWLRQAISEDVSEESPHPSEYIEENTLVTPLKKRRLAHYKEQETKNKEFTLLQQQQQEEQEEEEEEIENNEESERDKQEIESCKVLQFSSSSSTTTTSSSSQGPSSFSSDESLKKQLLEKLNLKAVLTAGLEEEEKCIGKYEVSLIKTNTTTTTAVKECKKKTMTEGSDKECCHQLSSTSTLSSSSSFPLDSSNVLREMKEENNDGVDKRKQEEIVVIGHVNKKEEDNNLIVVENIVETKDKIGVILKEIEIKNENKVDDVDTGKKVVTIVERTKEERQGEESSYQLSSSVSNTNIPSSKIESLIVKGDEEEEDRDGGETRVPIKERKKRVSLADYKRRRCRQDSISESSHLPSLPPRFSSLQKYDASKKKEEEKVTKKEEEENDILFKEPPLCLLFEEPGTPTLDEDHLLVMPTLSTLPLFEKLEQLEKAQKEKSCRLSSKKGGDGGGGVPSSVSSSQFETRKPETEVKREDLTERLKKEFGLVVEDSGLSFEVKNEGTPETGSSPSPPPPPPPHSHSLSHPSLPVHFQLLSSSSSSSCSTSSLAPLKNPSFTPTQYPSYPSNYPLPPYPASRTASAPHPPPSSTSRRSVSLVDYVPTESPRHRNYYSRESRYRDSKDHHKSSSSSSSSRHYKRNYYT